MVKVRRIDADGNYKDIFSSSKHLVPGDIIIVEDDRIAPCDFIITNGSCVINEAILTGESAAVLKNCLHDSNYDIENF